MYKSEFSVRRDYFKFFFIAIVGLIVIGLIIQALGGDQYSAENNAQKFMRDLNIVGTVTCARVDSDGDGYVSCTIRDDSGKMTAIECAALATFNSSCRLQKPGVVVR